MRCDRRRSDRKRHDAIAGDAIAGEAIAGGAIAGGVITGDAIAGGAIAGDTMRSQEMRCHSRKCDCRRRDAIAGVNCRRRDRRKCDRRRSDCRVREGGIVNRMSSNSGLQSPGSPIRTRRHNGWGSDDWWSDGDGVNDDGSARSPSRGRGIIHVGNGGRENGERVRRGRVDDVVEVCSTGGGEGSSRCSGGDGGSGGGDGGSSGNGGVAEWPASTTRETTRGESTPGGVPSQATTSSTAVL